MQLILIRHGRPETQAVETPPDPPLSDTGHAQAMAVGNALMAEGVDRIVSSGMRRADATAQPLVTASGLPLRQIEELGEIDRFGAPYVHMDAIRARGPAEWRRFMADPIGYCGVDAVMFRRAALDGFRHVLAEQEHSNVAIFTHGFPINILLSHVLGIDSIVRFIPYHASITRLSGDTIDRLTVVSINETGHLPGALR